MVDESLLDASGGGRSDPPVDRQGLAQQYRALVSLPDAEADHRATRALPDGAAANRAGKKLCTKCVSVADGLALT